MGTALLSCRIGGLYGTFYRSFGRGMRDLKFLALTAFALCVSIAALVYSLSRING